MTLTKKDEEKIRKIVREEFKVKNKEQHPNYDEWDEEAIVRILRFKTIRYFQFSADQITM